MFSSWRAIREFRYKNSFKLKITNTRKNLWIYTFGFWVCWNEVFKDIRFLPIRFFITYQIYVSPHNRFFLLNTHIFS